MPSGRSLRLQHGGSREEARAYVPSILDEGNSVSIRFDAAKPVGLVVFYIDANGHGDGLWPNKEEPEPEAKPGEPAILPSERERSLGIRYAASLSEPGKPTREQLVVYAFADKADFGALKPSAGGESADGVAYAADLLQKVQGIPLSRWAKWSGVYEIHPKGGLP